MDVLGDVRIKVKSEVLKSTSNDVLSKISDARAKFDELDSIITSAACYWEGEGFNSMLASYRRRVDENSNVFTKLTDHVKNLQEIAGVYEETESAIVNNESGLPTDALM